MLHLIPASLHRAGLKFAHASRKAWWKIASPSLTGVTVVATNGAGEFLLVRHTYGSRLWTLPGGGVRAGEDPEAAALREFAEELDCAIFGLAAAALHESILHGAPIVRHIFAGEVVGLPRPDRREVAEARFFARDSLPADCNAFVAQCLALLEQR